MTRLLVSGTSKPSPRLPNGVVFLNVDRPVNSQDVSILGLDPRDGSTAVRSPLSLNGVVMLPVFTANSVFFAGLDPSNVPNSPPFRSLFRFDFDTLGQSLPERFPTDFPAGRMGDPAPTFAVLLGLNTDPNEPTFCWTSESGDLFVQNGEGPASSPVPVSRQPPSVPIAYFNDNNEGRVLLLGDTPAGAVFTSATLVALPIGSDPQLAFTAFNRFGVAGPIRVNSRQFAAVAVSPGLTVRGGVVFSFDLNSL